MLKLLADMITPAPLYAANANPVVNMDKGCCICLQYLYLINLCIVLWTELTMLLIRRVLFL